MHVSETEVYCFFTPFLVCNLPHKSYHGIGIQLLGTVSVMAYVGILFEIHAYFYNLYRSKKLNVHMIALCLAVLQRP